MFPCLCSFFSCFSSTLSHIWLFHTFHILIYHFPIFSRHSSHYVLHICNAIITPFLWILKLVSFSFSSILSFSVCTIFSLFFCKSTNQSTFIILLIRRSLHTAFFELNLWMYNINSRWSHDFPTMIYQSRWRGTGDAVKGVRPALNSLPWLFFNLSFFLHF